MADYLGPIVGAVCGAAVSSAGFLAKRFAFGEGRKDRAALVTSYANLAAMLKSNGLSIEEVENIETLIQNRQNKKIEVEDTLNKPMSPYWTQAAMNIRARGAASVAEARLSSAIQELVSILTEEDTAAFDLANSAWENFADTHCHFVAREFNGGTMQSLIYSSARENVTLQRLKSIEAILEERKDR